MATVGQQLLSPESGWQRIEESNVNISYSSGWVDSIYAGYSGGCAKYSNTAGSSANFIFNGTKLRIIGGNSDPAYSSNCSVYIDSILYNYSNHYNTDGATYDFICFEITGLLPGTHTVKVVAPGVGYYINIDAFDIDTTGEILEYCAFIGGILTNPEDGWKRYLYNDPNILYSGTWSTYGNIHAYSRDVGSYAAFNFTGPRIRLIATGQDAGTALSTSEIYIDNIKAGTMEQSTFSGQYILEYEATGLTNSEHCIKILVTVVGSVTFSAVDINSTDTIKPYNPWINKTKTFISNMIIGDRISCEYTAISNTFGTLVNLGKATKAEIPVTSTATPDGTFYFIFVGYDTQDRMKFIADRNIQYGISWDVLNTAGIASSSGAITKIDNKDYIIRLLTGGVSSTDTDNEWDKIIVNHNLTGAATAGDNSVWNWSNIWTSTSTTNTARSDYRTVRGYSSVSDSAYVNSAETAASSSGFRPVLIVNTSYRYITFKTADNKLYGIL